MLIVFMGMNLIAILRVKFNLRELVWLDLLYKPPLSIQRAAVE